MHWSQGTSSVKVTLSLGRNKIRFFFFWGGGRLGRWHTRGWGMPFLLLQCELTYLERTTLLDVPARQIWRPLELGIKLWNAVMFRTTIWMTLKHWTCKFQGDTLSKVKSMDFVRSMPEEGWKHSHHKYLHWKKNIMGFCNVCFSSFLFIFSFYLAFGLTSWKRNCTACTTNNTPEV